MLLEKFSLLSIAKSKYLLRPYRSDTPEQISIDDQKIMLKKLTEDKNYDLVNLELTFAGRLIGYFKKDQTWGIIA